mgnify:CR=1 FL=1
MLCLTSPVETSAHRWRPGIKFALLCAATFVLLAIDSLVFQVAAFLGCLLLFALPGRTFFLAGMRALKPLWPFVVILIVWHGITQDMADGLAIVLRLMTAVGLATLVTMTTRLSDMMDFVRWALQPLARFGLQTRLVELGIALVIRFTPALAAQGRQLAQSWRARAHQKPRWQLILPLTVAAIDDAEQVAQALRARGGLMPHNSGVPTPARTD